MLNRLTLFFAFSIILCSCGDPVKRIDTKMQQEFAPRLSASLQPMAATLEFYNYAVPENYWYPDGTGFAAILNDKYHSGMQKLENLDRKIGRIGSTNDVIADDISELHEKITEELGSFNHFMQSVDEIINGSGGIAGVMNGLMNSGSEGRLALAEAVRMPGGVRIALGMLANDIEYAQVNMRDTLRRFELSMTNGAKLTQMQLGEVRKNLKNIVTQEIKKQYNDTDTTALNQQTTLFLNRYDAAYPVGSAAPASRTIDSDAAQAREDALNSQTLAAQAGVNAAYLIAHFDYKEIRESITVSKKEFIDEEADIAVMDKMMAAMSTGAGIKYGKLKEADKLVKYYQEIVKDFKMNAGQQ